MIGIVRTDIKKLTVLVLVFALIFSGISPFCVTRAAASQDLIEICTAEGIKVIDRETGAPVSGDEAPADTQKKKSCAYCFTTNLARVSPDIVFFPLPPPPRGPGLKIRDKDIIPLSLRGQRYEARAPPATA
ncbi:MAG: hypothetical protein H6861_01285 [Rhodospirillales bacterium]|nr:hypothetical protein [Rhodospirillales bacterium]